MALRALLLVDHGSRSDEANRVLVELGALLRDRVGPAVAVEIAHQELASPSIAEGFARCVAGGAQEVIVMPYFLAPGRHATQDLPERVAALASEYPGVNWRVAEPLGVHPLMAELVLLRCGIERSPEGRARGSKERQTSAVGRGNMSENE